ncbi:MAG: sigma-54-dependent Fis family transcriptional regulator [Alphaproteobacteria bacterium]|nr:sigma-54-dependent Fis family transcriptional regulator [Alphaproteobacteria bacterium]
MSIGRVLIIEDSPSLARTYEAQLKRDAAAIEIVEDGAGGERAMGAGRPDCILLDLGLPDANGMDLLRSWRAAEISTPVVVITANGSINTAIDAMREGATDFLVKPFGAERLVTTVKNAVEKSKLEKVVKAFEQSKPKAQFAEFVGSSLPMQAVYRVLESAAPSNAGVFITGETGTGKELAARAVHTSSARAGRAFIAVNCGAIPKDLIESELFGHVKGAFTGATTDRAGAAELANGGTLFLDEIGEMPIDLQPKLLRFLQTGTYARVGDSRIRQTDIRIVAATNRDPWGAVRAGRLREDLYFRLNVIPVELPPLRDRAGDILMLADAFLARYAEEEGRADLKFADDARQALLQHYWPGNVRELENLVRRCVVLAEGDEIAASDLSLTQGFAAAAPTHSAPDPVQPAALAPAPSVAAPYPPVNTAPVAGGIEPLWVVEKRTIEHAIALCGDNITEASKQLEIAPSTIYRKREQWAEKT